MKKILYGYKALLLLTVVLCFGCEKALDINTSPNNPSIDAATPEVLFPSATFSTAGRVGGELGIIGSFWSQFWTQSNASNQYKTIDAYNLQKTDYNGSYNELFGGALSDYQLAITKAVAREDWRYNLMCTAMKAYTYEVLVDLYDQVPYSEAFQGQANLQPKFEDGYTVYVGLLAELNAALAKDYKSVALSTDQKKTDFIFAGDMNKWEQFANTLKLKMYLRMVNAKPAEAQAGINALYTAGANFLTVNAGITAFTDVPDGSNPAYEYNIRRLNTTTNIRASITFTTFLAANSDPRAVSYFGTASPIGIHQGDFTATLTAQPTYANATTAVQKATDPVWFISAAESYFMQAEALERYYAGVGAKAKYDAGVTAAFAQVGLTPGALIAAGGKYEYPVAGTFQQKLKAIITQKWASMPGSHGLEAFFEQQRTGYPAISTVYSTNATYATAHAGEWVYSKNGATSGKFPKRLVFPASERDRNKNTPAEVPIYTKVWWGL